jgi:peroxiredoxin
MMRNIFRVSLLVFTLLITSGLLNAQGYSIDVTMKPFKNQYIYLGYHYGKIKALADSVLLNENSKGTFQGKERLPGGIYFLVSPQKQILLEVLIDKDQQFSVSADTSNLPASIVFNGTNDNSAFQQYSLLAGKNGQEISRLQQSVRSGLAPKDSAAAVARMRSINEKMQFYRDSTIQKDPSSFLSMLFQAMKEPVVPPAPKLANGKTDSTFGYRYFKGHFWDGVSFDDERLVRTPFFEPKLDRYFKDLVVPQSDSLIKEVDAMLLEARTSPEMFKYLLVKFVQQYVNPEYMGQDAVFVHLFEKYINTGQATFFTKQYRDFIDKRAYSLMANLIGQPAADMEMVDSTGKKLNLYSVKSNYTVVVFWDPTCGHCKELVPKVDSIYKAKWKGQGVKVYAVKTDGPPDEWQKFIKEHQLNDWLHVYQQPATEEAITRAGKPGFRQLYDVYQTPVMYLLDKDKRIIAKKLGYLQMDDVLQLKIKNPS